MTGKDDMIRNLQDQNKRNIKLIYLNSLAVRELNGEDVSNLPEEPTNGDILRALFPTCDCRSPREDIVQITIDGVVGTTVTKYWWESPYHV